MQQRRLLKISRSLEALMKRGKGGGGGEGRRTKGNAREPRER